VRPMAKDAYEAESRLNVGLLWYDADPRRKAEAKIGDAVERYEEKFGGLPNVCHVSPETCQALGDEVDGIGVVANRWIRPNHFWLGVDPGRPRRRRQPVDRDRPADEARRAQKRPRRGSGEADRGTGRRPTRKAGPGPR
jgi:hypothetical protein